ncbi:MAG: hypothetical protein ACU837_08880 [Gammaproteobacteria bacterium]
MEIQDTYDNETARKIKSGSLIRSREKTELFPSKRHASTDGQTQPEQLGTLARVVMETLGLSREEALQMAKDLGFLKP